MDKHEFFEAYVPTDSEHGSAFLLQDLGQRFVSEPHPEAIKIEVAILGIPEDRGSRDNKGCATGANAVRDELYRLQDHFAFGISDLGNLKRGNTLDDTYKALEMVLIDLEAEKIFPIVIGGSQDLCYSQFTALGRSNNKIDLLAIDSCFDLDDRQETGRSGGASSTWLTAVLSHEPDILFNYSNIGYQTYFASEPVLRLMDKLSFDIYRLGELASNIHDTEPVIRSAHMISFDINAIRFSDAPARGRQNPHGFYGEEACQLMRFAGLNSQLSSLGLYEYNPTLDVRNQTAQLLAQMIWYFLDGFAYRKQENPLTHSSHFVKYRTMVNKQSTEILFYKSRKSKRWWMQVPYPENIKRNDHVHLVPCLYEDFQAASQGEMPDRWWRTYQKL